MPPPFIALTLPEFKRLLDDWDYRRKINEVHMHHTWRPNHAQFRGHDSIVGMWRYHTQTNGWSDIAQHVTIDPQGVIWTGRHWDLPPASSSGRNGTRALGPFMLEMVGDFDEGGDKFQDPQRDAALWVVALLQKKFDLPPASLKFHRDLGSPKSCPGTAVDYDDVISAVKELRERDLPRTRDRGARFANYDPGAQAREWLRQPVTPIEEGADAEPEEGVEAQRNVGRVAAVQGAHAPSRDSDTFQLLRNHVINLSNGMLSDQGDARTDEGDVRRIFEEELPRRIKKLGNGNKLPIVLYCHGGLVSEVDGLAIAASQTPWWLDNGVYPISFVWETGIWETLAGMIGVGRDRGVFGDLRDAAVEAAVRAANSKSIWQAMKFSAARSFESDGGGAIILKHLGKFLKASGQKVTLHAVGHSAGSIFHSYFLPNLIAGGSTKIDSLCMLAPAITVADFKVRLAPHIGNDISRLVMFTMNKPAELADSVTPLYGKSLLYLIRQALEPRIGEPILGLEESVRADAGMRKLFGLGQPGNAVVVWSPTDLRTGRRASGSTTHGDFDNDAPTMESVAREVLDLPDAAPVKPFPVDRVARQAAIPPSKAPPRIEVASSEIAAAPPVAVAYAPTLFDVAAGLPMISTGQRRALCVGIDEYPDPRDRLNGCVADARAWAAAFAALGFEVESLHNASATRQNILDRLSQLVAAANVGDTVVLQFAAHGTQLEDTDGDEDDDKDEAFCPVDYAVGHFIVDDDFRRIFARLNPGAAFTCFFDTCNSGTITRLAVGRAASAPGSRARFIVATPAMNHAHRQFRSNQPRAVASAGRSAMRHVVFAACKPDESALERNGRGDFSVVAVPLLAHAGRISNRRFSELVTAAFGQERSQNPNLDCEPAAENSMFLFAGGVTSGGLRGAQGGSYPDKSADLAALVELVTRLAR